MKNCFRLTRLQHGGYVIADPNTLTWSELTETAAELLLHGSADGCSSEEAQEFLDEATAMGWTSFEVSDGQL